MTVLKKKLNGSSSGRNDVSFITLRRARARAYIGLSLPWINCCPINDASLAEEPLSSRVYMIDSDMSRERRIEVKIKRYS